MDPSSLHKLLRFQQVEVDNLEDIQFFFHRVMMHLFVCLPHDRPLTSQSIRASLQSRLRDRIWRESEKAIDTKRRILRPRKVYRWMNTRFPDQKVHTKTLLFFTSLLENLFLEILRDASSFAKTQHKNPITLQTIQEMFAQHKRDLFAKELLLLCSNKGNGNCHP